MSVKLIAKILSYIFLIIDNQTKYIEEYNFLQKFLQGTKLNCLHVFQISARQHLFQRINKIAFFSARRRDNTFFNASTRQHRFQPFDEIACFSSNPTKY